MNVDLVSGQQRSLSARTFFNINALKWLPNGSGLLLTARENLAGRIKIWQVAIADGETHALSRDATDYVEISLDEAADKMIATYTTNNFHLYLTHGQSLTDASVLTTAVSVTFAPDGKIIYSGNDHDIWTVNPDGAEQRQLTNNAGTNFSPRVSPDGRYIFFTSNRSGANQVWRMDTDGSNQVQVTKTEGGYPRFVAPDGKWVYFESGLHETIWRAATDGTEQTQITNGPTPLATFSPDGKLAAYLMKQQADSKLQLGLISIPDAKLLKTFSVEDKAADVWAMFWAKDNKSFNYVATSPAKTCLWNQPIDTETPQLLEQLGNDEIWDISMAPDGNSLAFIRGKWIHDAVLIEGLQ